MFSITWTTASAVGQKRLVHRWDCGYLQFHISTLYCEVGEGGHSRNIWGRSSEQDEEAKELDVPNS